MKFIRKSLINLFIMMQLYTIFVFGFKCPEKNGLFPNPYDCKTFYQCANGYPYLMHCPDDLQWSSALSRCEWPENSDCGV
ncbi:family 31 glucosidase [Gigaspora margarita]|uniref:Family 31 glucosidase n=1 Tax=Gigaspora margarita TaxID=4874 RepID=A0A8H4AJV8_GIGMA|nr:family 31 glucosidase [Gigaspora margarita]